MRLALPHRGDSQQIVAGILRGEGGFAQNRRCEARKSSQRQITATPTLTAPDPSSHSGGFQQRPVPIIKGKAVHQGPPRVRRLRTHFLQNLQSDA